MRRSVRIIAPLSSLNPVVNDENSGRNDELDENSRRNDKPLGEFIFCEIDKDEIERIQELGRGNGGSVWKVRNTKLNTLMAQKIIHFEVKPDERKAILRELQILQHCNHPNIIGFYGAFFSPVDLSICMEYMDGLSLDIVTKNTGRIPEPILGKISVAVVNGISYLKSLHILHRDVKPSNILVNSKGEIKLCDFGVSKQLLNSSKTRSFVGTRSYMAPERLNGMEYSVKSDIWSFGFSLVEVAIGRYPIPVPTFKELTENFHMPLKKSPSYEEENENERTKDERRSFRFKKTMSMRNLRSFRRKSIKSVNVQNTRSSIDEAKRNQPTSIFELISCILKGPPPILPIGIFSDDFTSMIEMCLQKDPELRVNLATLQNHPFIERSANSDINFVQWVVECLLKYSNNTAVDTIILHF